jgi:hypothetical protein
MGASARLQTPNQIVVEPPHDQACHGCCSIATA